MAFRPLSSREVEIARRKGIRVSSDTMVDEMGNLAEPERDFGVSGFARQAAGSIIPQVAGRAGGAALGLLGGPLAPITVPAGFILGGMGTKIAQDAALGKIEEKYPTSALGRFASEYRRDIEQHPYASMLSSFATSPVGGGGLNPFKQGTARQIAQRAGAGAGIDVGTQVVSSALQGDVNIDPVQALISAAGMGLLSKPSTGYRNLERRALQKVGKRMDTPFMQQFAPEMPIASSALSPERVKADYDASVGRPGAADITLTSGIPPHQRAEYNPDWLLSTDVKNLLALGDYEKAVAGLRGRGIPLSPDDLETLSWRGVSQGFDTAAKSILAAKLPMMEGQAAVTDPAVASSMALRSSIKPASVTANVLAEQQSKQARNTEIIAAKNAADVTRAQQAGAKQQDAAAVAKTAQQLGTEMPVKSAEESAAVIAARTGAVKDVDQEVKDYKKLKKTRDDMLVLARKQQEGSAERVVAEEVILNLDENLRTREAEIIRRGGGKLLFGDRSVVPEGYELPKSKEKTVPETDATLQEQLNRLKTALTPENPKQVVLIPEGTVVPQETPAGTVKTPTEKGVAIHDPKVISPEKVVSEVSAGREGELIGLGVSGKPAGATDVVTVTTPKNVEVQSAVVVPETAPAAVKAAEAMAKPEDKIEIKPAAEVLNKRVEGATPVKLAKGNVVKLPSGEEKLIKSIRRSGDPVFSDGTEAKAGEVTIVPIERIPIEPGDRVKFGDKEFTVKLVKKDGTVTFDGNKRYPSSVDEISWMQANEKAEVFAKTSKESVIAEKEADQAEVNKKLANPKFEESVQSLVEFANSPGRLSSKVRSLIRSHPNYKSGREGEFLKTLTKAEQDRMIELVETGAETWTIKKGGIGAGIKRAVRKNKEAGMVINPLKLLSERTQSPERVVETLGKLGKKLVKKFQQTRVEQKALEGPMQDEVNKLAAGMSEQEKTTLGKFLGERRHNGASSVVLSPKLKKISDLYDRVVKLVGLQKSQPNSPWVVSYDLDGKPTYRPFVFSPNYVPEYIDPKVRDILMHAEKDQVKYKSLRDDFLNYILSNGVKDRAAAENIFSQRVKIAAAESAAPNPEFAALRFEEGVGLPESWRADPITALKHHIARHSIDLAWHRNIESDPELAFALGWADNGRGVKTPSELSDAQGNKIEKGSLGGNESVKALMRDYVGATSPEMQQFEKYDRLAKSLMVQTWSNARDILTAPGIFMEVATVPEARFVGKAIMDAFNPSVREEGIRAGAVRPERNLAPASAIDAADGANKLADIITEVTGSERLNTVLRTFYYSLGKSIARNRIAQGDTAFIEDFGPLDWGRMNREKLVDYIATRLTGTFAGTYSAEGLPAKLSRGSTSAWKPLFSLSRWSVERYNNWYKNVYQQAEKGNIKPLIRSLAGAALSAEVVNFLTEKILGRKPRELSWPEYLKLGGKDTAYTMFSKAMTAGYAGILGDIAFMGVQGYNKEMPRGYANVLIDSVGEAVERGLQWESAFANGEAGLLDLPSVAGQIIKDRTQLVRLMAGTKDTGNREEKIARRVGYLPPGSLRKQGLPNMFGESAAYRSEDPEKLGSILRKKMDERREISGPDTQMRPPGYYEFIKAAQGAEAAGSAKGRDREDTIRRREIFRQAIQASRSR